MTREKAKTLLPIIQAFCEGKQIQFLFDEWKDVDEIGIREFLENPELYRIKPETKYRPFKNAKECWQEMQKHQPFGWMKFKDTECGYYMLTSVAAGVGVGINDSLFSYERIFNDYTFADGTPFGVKVEEE
jgi:hypothetical protein